MEINSAIDEYGYAISGLSLVYNWIIGYKENELKERVLRLMFNWYDINNNDGSISLYLSYLQIYIISENKDFASKLSVPIITLNMVSTSLSIK